MIKGIRILLLALFLCATSCRPDYVHMRAPSGGSVDVISLREIQQAELDQLVPHSGLRSALFLSYYERDLPNDTADHQLDDAVAIALVRAAQTADSVILVERNIPILRGTGLVRGQRYAFRRLGTGRWRHLSL